MKALCFIVAFVLLPRLAAADQPLPRPTLFWLATQLLPTPEWHAGDSDPRFALRWQAAPVVYAFGLNDRVDKWRALVVEPNARYGGSVELYVSGGVFTSGSEQAYVRTGGRVYAPILHRGEYLSGSIGAAYQRTRSDNDVVLEVGAYMLFGIVGIQVAYVPDRNGPTTFSLATSVRYF